MSCFVLLHAVAVNAMIGKPAETNDRISHTCPILTTCIRSTNQLYRRYVSIHRSVVTYGRTVIYSWTIFCSWYNVVPCRRCVIQHLCFCLAGFRPSSNLLCMCMVSQMVRSIDQSDPLDKAVYGRTIFYRWIYSNPLRTKISLCSLKIAEVGNVNKA